MKRHIPQILLYSRIVFAFAIAGLALFRPEKSRYIVLALMYVGIVSDIFDGIIARRLNVSTDGFRVLDTVFDLLFYSSVLFFIYTINAEVLSQNQPLIMVIIVLECLMYALSLLRFGKLPSPHAILSKCWGLYLVVEFSLLVLGVPGSHFAIALVIGTMVHVDRVLIYVLIPGWEHDIPSCYHALLLRQGKAIRRNRIFNG